MPRTDIHLDAMLRHLGAAYYESLHGRATHADVTRALDTVEEHLNEPGAGGQRSAGHPDRGHRAGHEANADRHSHGWSRRVSDVMTPTVITVDRITPYKEVARLMAEHRISGLPVLKMGREVVGVVTEADLLREQASTARRLRSSARRTWRPGGLRPPALTAGELMTSPAIVIGPDATVPAAARLMTAHHVQRLPVNNEKGKLVGIVSRRDLISVFLRPDADIAADIRRVLDDVVLARPGEANVAVHNGIVTLTGTLDPKAGVHGDLIPVALRLMWDVDGVVDVVDRLGEEQAAPPAQAVPPDAIPAQATRPPENRPADAG
ncbi:MAG: CBS domain-containing protein [Trebonia sp.]|jgi:CBS-domain-containing membrane protein